MYHGPTVMVRLSLNESINDAETSMVTFKRSLHILCRIVKSNTMARLSLKKSGKNKITSPSMDRVNDQCSMVRRVTLNGGPVFSDASP